jgi:hypothetical protein
MLLPVDRLPCARRTLARSDSLQSGSIESVVAGRGVENRKDRITQALARLKIAAGNVFGAGAPIIQTRRSFSAKALQPLAHGAFGYLELAGNGRVLLPAVGDATNALASMKLRRSF